MMTLLQRAVLVSLLVVILAACAPQPEYTPDMATLAAREQAEYDARQSRISAAWTVGMVFFGVILLIVIVLVGFLSRVGYRLQAARATKSEHEARRLLLVDLGNGAVLDLQTNVIRAVNYTAPPQTTRAAPAAPVVQRQAPTSPQAFVIQCVQINDGDWESDVIPRWDRWHDIGAEMTSADWMRMTDEFVRLGLIVKEPGKRTVVAGDGDMRWLYDSLPPHPTGG